LIHNLHFDLNSFQFLRLFPSPTAAPPTASTAAAFAVEHCEPFFFFSKEKSLKKTNLTRLQSFL